jgi:hypothetical protein
MRLTSRISLHALALLMGASLLALPAAAQEPAPDRADSTDAQWAHEAREIEFAVDAAGATFQSTRASDLGEDLIQVDFDLAAATYHYQFISTEPDNTSTIRVDLAFVALVEFEDVDRDGRYGLGDTMVHRVPLADHAGATITRDRDIADDARKATATFPLEGQDGDGLPPIGGGALDQPALHLDFLFTSDPLLSDGDRVDPTQQPVIVRIHDYPYDANATGSRLALEMRLTTPAAEEASADDLRAQDGFFDVVFGWDGTASTDGVTSDVGVTTLTDPRPGEGTLITVAYLRADQIEHAMGFQSVRYDGQGLSDIVDALIKGDWRIYGIGMLFSVAAVGGPAYLRLRRGA